MTKSEANSQYVRDLLRVHAEIAATLRDAEIELCYIERAMAGNS